MSTSMPSVAFQQAEISAALNSAMLFIFLTGIYTVVYFGTLYIYQRRKAPQRLIIIAVITLLFILGICNLALEWYATTWIFVKNGSTQESVFIQMYDSPEWIVLVAAVTSFGMTLLADALIIWRCFHIWGHSFRIILLPSFLFVAEFALALATIILVAIEVTEVQTERQVQISNSISVASSFVSAGTSLLSTYLIVRRIYSVSHESKTSSRRFRRIVRIVVESALIYSLVQVVQAVVGIVPPKTLPASLPVWAFQNYGSSLAEAITGIIPTVMVARVALASSSVDDIDLATKMHDLTALQFDESHTTQNETGSRIGIIQIVNEMKNEGEKEIA